MTVLASDPKSDRPAWRASWFNRGVTARPSTTSVHSAHANPAGRQRAHVARLPRVIPMLVGACTPLRSRSASQASSVACECGRPPSRDRYGGSVGGTQVSQPPRELGRRSLSVRGVLVNGSHWWWLVL